MFTGIVQGCATLRSRTVSEAGERWCIGGPAHLFQNLEIGASVAVNGCCLTAVARAADWMEVDLVGETLARTHFGDLSEGASLNLERSLKFGDEVGGHILSGHVHCCAQLIARDGETFRFRAPPEWAKYLISKGFIGLAGCSLTLGALGPADGEFCVHLIPETLRLTNLDALAEGDRVNIEFEQQTVAVVETVERVLAVRGAG
ncbi:MAG: riboflavin synthase subunit alpha [Gammaproteobacteria bacterium AqS3]|nr:riboflavin synthase subunit alpha [Gammaproteobacteria bacterium AqS3]